MHGLKKINRGNSWLQFNDCKGKMEYMGIWDVLEAYKRRQKTFFRISLA